MVNVGPLVPPVMRPLLFAVGTPLPNKQVVQKLVVEVRSAMIRIYDVSIGTNFLDKLNK